MRWCALDWNSKYHRASEKHLSDVYTLASYCEVSIREAMIIILTWMRFASIIYTHRWALKKICTGVSYMVR